MRRIRWLKWSTARPEAVTDFEHQMKVWGCMQVCMRKDAFVPYLAVVALPEVLQ